MTISLAARCAATGRFGVIIASSSPAVAARCAHVRAATGSVCTQNITDPRLGPRILDLMLTGFNAQTAIDAVVATTEDIKYRQLSCVDMNGDCGVFSGAGTLGCHATTVGSGGVAAGNLLADAGVPAAMIEGFGDDPSVDLGDRLLAGMQSGLEAGGEEGPIHSAGLLIADMVSWPVTDLRVDWADQPVEELAELWEIWKPQWEDYVIRALKPELAPGFGVPGDVRP